jgi:hypothetical protein
MKPFLPVANASNPIVPPQLENKANETRETGPI